ncbi:class I SAM-dependent methyltransferase [Thalassospira lucentensis]|uniref:class I SAM-dependent methyltransferase n=1 Tax=Thalassospira lucentensis TaxID=168935 RepID=UPI00142E827B|nr:class I SAM-dependent methyltransferase [Thalassospira lucentensis]
MQKDYLPIEADLEEKSEIERVDAFWSSVWQDLAITSDLVQKKIEASDEYRVISDYLSELPAGASFLDGGCGMGEWVNYLHRRGFKPTDLDMSSSTISRLKKEFPNLQWETGDINKLSHTDKSFDAYISWGTFEHFEAGLSTPISEAYRILKPGGFLFITVPQDSLRLFFQKYHGDWNNTHQDAGKKYAFYQWRLTKREIAFEVKQQPFIIKSIPQIHKTQGIGRLFTGLTKMNTSGPITARIVKLLSYYAGHSRWPYAICCSPKAI